MYVCNQAWRDIPNMVAASAMRNFDEKWLTFYFWWNLPSWPLISHLLHQCRVLCSVTRKLRASELSKRAWSGLRLQHRISHWSNDAVFEWDMLEFQLGHLKTNKQTNLILQVIAFVYSLSSPLYPSLPNVFFLFCSGTFPDWYPAIDLVIFELHVTAL